MIRHIQRDDLETPNAGAQLPDWQDRQRRPDPTLPPWLWPAALLGLALVLLVALAAAWPSLQALGELFRGAMVEYAPHVRLALFLCLLAGLAGIVAAVWRAAAAVGALGARARVVRTQHDAPIDVDTLRRPEWDALIDRSTLGALLVEQTWAAHSGQRNLAALTYSPSFHNRQDGSASEGAPALPAPLPAVPSFGELLASGAIGQGVPMLLGIDAETGEGVRGTFKSLYSTGIGGLQGSGKSWAAASVLAQSALQGARLVVLDPHAGDAESLAQRVAGLSPAFLCDVADDERAITAALKLVAGELMARKRGTSQDRRPLILAADEWLALRRGALGDLVPDVAEMIATEGRKLGVHCLLLSQMWPKDAIGRLRNSLASAYVFRLRADEARMLSGLPAGIAPNDTMQLRPGEAYLVDTSGTLRRVFIPRMTVGDMEAIGAQLRGARPLGAGQGAIAASLAAGASAPPSAGLPFGFRPPGVEAPRKAPGSPPERPAASPSTAAESGAPLDAEAARILALFQAGKTLGEIAREISGTTGGRAYQEAQRRIESVLRRAMGGT